MFNLYTLISIKVSLMAHSHSTPLLIIFSSLSSLSYPVDPALYKLYFTAPSIHHKRECRWLQFITLLIHHFINLQLSLNIIKCTTFISIWELSICLHHVVLMFALYSMITRIQPILCKERASKHVNFLDVMLSGLCQK